MKRFDYILFLSGAALAVAGFFEIFSTADTFHFVTNQLAAFLAGVLLFFFFAFFFTSRHFVKLAPVLYGISLLLLVIVLKRGVRIRGSLSWLTFGKYSFQPAELMKFSVLLVVSSYLEKKHKYLGDLKLAGVLFFIFLIPILLILKQPDMGSSLIFLSFFFFYLYASGISYIFIILFVIFLFAFIAAFALNILLGISLLQNILVFAAALAVFFLLTRIFIKFIFVPGVKRNFMLLFVFFFVLGSASGYGIEHFLKQYQK
ncbi:MAG TPA: FtsW/RodA/SpoVE family cell cycle protein, partial [bacterium]|nr:FtsW/RodA/SpoVE family cell cycle protein [bacterium]